MKESYHILGRIRPAISEYKVLTQHAPVNSRALLKVPPRPNLFAQSMLTILPPLNLLIPVLHGLRYTASPLLSLAAPYNLHFPSSFKCYKIQSQTLL